MNRGPVLNRGSNRPQNQGLLLLTWIINYDPTMVSNYNHYKVWDEITYPSSNFNGAAVEVREWVSNFTTHLSIMWLLVHAEIKVVNKNYKNSTFLIDIEDCCTNPTMQQSSNAPTCNRNVHTGAHFCCKMVHCGISVWCMVGFVRWDYWHWKVY